MYGALQRTSCHMIFVIKRIRKTNFMYYDKQDRRQARRGSMCGWPPGTVASCRLP